MATTRKQAFESIDAYIASKPAEVQPILEELRQAIHAAAPEAVEAIKYDLPTFRLAGTYVIYFAGWKNHIGMYPVSFGDAAFEAEIGPYRAEKDTVQFRYADPLPRDLVARIVRDRVAALAARTK